MTGAPRPRLSTSRRGVLLGGMGAAVATALGACGRSAPASPAPTTPSSSAPASPYSGDLRVVALAAALENLAVRAYTLARSRATAGRYGTLPPALSTFLATAQAQHQAHAAAWNALLTKAGSPRVTGTPLRDATSLLASFSAAASVHDLSAAAGALEVSLAGTCLAAVGSVSEAGAIGLAAGIAPVEAQHAAVLNLFLATVPAPQSTFTTSSAVSTEALTA